MDQFLKALSAFNPNGAMSNADADNIWKSYKAAGGGGPVKIFGQGGGFGGLGGGGILGGIQRMMAPGAAPAVPGDGAMGPTIGPGAAAPAPASTMPQFKPGLPQGGILGLLQGQSPQGLIGMLQGMNKQPIAGSMPQVGMANTGVPGSQFQGPVPPGLPMNIDPTTQF
jgi:hypothetical protein